MLENRHFLPHKAYWNVTTMKGRNCGNLLPKPPCISCLVGSLEVWADLWNCCRESSFRLADLASGRAMVANLDGMFLTWGCEDWAPWTVHLKSPSPLCTTTVTARHACMRERSGLPPVKNQQMLLGLLSLVLRHPAFNAKDTEIISRMDPFKRNAEPTKENDVTLTSDLTFSVCYDGRQKNIYINL